MTIAVRQERARADRNGGKFSLVTIAFGGAHWPSSMLDEVTEYLACRVRISDQYARTDDGRLWLILPECPADAAARRASDICQRFSGEKRRTTYDLYHYSSGTKGDRRHADASDAATRVAGENAAQGDVESPLVRATPSWKRILDVLIAAVALISLSPLLALVAVLIKLNSPGPIFFTQLRAGRSGKPFRMYKFRTMIADAEQRKTELIARNEQDGPAFKMEHDPRVTWWGRFLRATSIDELPQIWNVLRGEMSLVGPRPLPVDESAGCESWQLERLDVTPGMTCSWQVSDRHKKIPFVEWMRMDIRYARNYSPALDLSLLFQTVLFVIQRRGV